MSRLSPGTLIVAIFAIMFGLVGAYAARKYLERGPIIPANRVFTVPVAAFDLEAGRPLQSGDLFVASRTPAELAKFPVESITNPKLIVGRVLRRPLEKGESFTADMFYPEGMGPGVAERLRQGFRAVTIPIEDDGAVAGFATPGSLVDVLFRSASIEKRGIPEKIVTLVEGAEVLAINENPVKGSRPTNKGKEEEIPQMTVTLAVLPPHVSLLKVAQGRGELSLAMRMEDDELDYDTRNPMTLEELLEVRNKRGPHVVEVYRGSQRQTVTFDQEQAVEERFGGLPQRPLPRTTMRPIPKRRDAQEPHPDDLSSD